MNSNAYRQNTNRANAYRSSANYKCLMILTCLSFGAARWYCLRGTSFLAESNLPAVVHELFAFLAAAVVPSIVFEALSYFEWPMSPSRKRAYGISSGPYNQHTRSGYDELPPEALKALISSETKKFGALRLFLIAANLVCFGLSFLYFQNRILYVWGRILLNFLVSLIFFVGFLFYQSRKTEKNRMARLIAQTGRIYMITYAVVVLADMFFSLGI